MSSFWKGRIILPSITSWWVDWRSWIKDADRLGITELALFMTGIKLEERKELFTLLEESKIKSIPFIHLKSDMKLEELDYFVERWGTKAFNIHPERQYRLENDLRKYKDIIFMENVFLPLDEEEVKKWGGLCIDVCHIEETKIRAKEFFEPNLKIMKKVKVGCNHISPLQKDVATDFKFKNSHLFHKFSEFDYLKKYDKKFFGRYIALETRNPLEEQLKMLRYVVELLNDKK